jgi:hypothetical protein
MTRDYAGPSSRPLALLLIVALHAVGVLCWPKRDANKASAARSRETAIAFVSMAAPVPVPATPRRPVTPVRAKPRKAPAPPEAMRLIAPAPVPEVAAQAPLAPPQKSAADILRQARLDVGKIDRELRSASLDTAQRHLVLTPTKREQGIAAAFVERGPTKVVEEVMSDGRRRSRIGNKCAYMESNGLVGGRDVFRNGVRTRWERC